MARGPRKPSATQGRRYLEETVPLRVRFQEVDSMSVVWHGHYISYFEEARRAFGRRYDLDYPVFLEHAVVAPITQVWVEYLNPARMTDTLDVTARLYESEGAKLEFRYRVCRGADGQPLAAGGSVQVFTTLTGELILTRPPFLIERYRRWEACWQLDA